VVCSHDRKERRTDTHKRLAGQGEASKIVRPEVYNISLDLATLFATFIIHLLFYIMYYA